MYRTAVSLMLATFALAAPLGAQGRGRAVGLRRSAAVERARHDDNGHVTRRFVDSRGRLCTEKVHEKRNGDRKYSLDCKARKGRHGGKYDRYDRRDDYDRDDRDGRYDRSGGVTCIDRDRDGWCDDAQGSGYPSRYPTTGSRYPATGNGGLADIVGAIMGTQTPGRP